MPVDFDVRLSVIERESEHLAAAARGRLELPVPTCPDWTVDDLVTHVATTYLHKVACTRLNAQPKPWPVDPPSGDRVTWLLRARDEMLALFRERGPDAPSYTWEPSDQTVGFWARRMAVESSLHRVDVAIAAGEAYRLDPDLAEDGIDETLSVVLGGDWSDEPQAPPDHFVRLRIPGRCWLVSLRERQVEVIAAPESEAGEATIEGSGEDVLLWLWARPTHRPLTITGDESAVGRLRAQLALVTG
jgi:uncharacterized protein (TIGR03083 family)